MKWLKLIETYKKGKSGFLKDSASHLNFNPLGKRDNFLSSCTEQSPKFEHQLIQAVLAQEKKPPAQADTFVY